MEDFIRRRRLKSVKLGVAAGLGFGIYMTMLSHVHVLFPSFGNTLVAIWQDLYPLYSPTFWGSWVLLGWGFLDGFFLLWLIGTLYNWLTQSGYGCRNWPSGKRAKGGSFESKNA